MHSNGGQIVQQWRLTKKREDVAMKVSIRFTQQWRLQLNHTRRDSYWSETLIQS